jgi:hypothetical protein
MKRLMLFAFAISLSPLATAAPPQHPGTPVMTPPDTATYTVAAPLKSATEKKQEAQQLQAEKAEAAARLKAQEGLLKSQSFQFPTVTDNAITIPPVDREVLDRLPVVPNNPYESYYRERLYGDIGGTIVILRDPNNQSPVRIDPNDPQGSQWRIREWFGGGGTGADDGRDTGIIGNLERAAIYGNITDINQIPDLSSTSIPDPREPIESQVAKIANYKKMFDDSDEDACCALFCLLAQAKGSIPSECHQCIAKYFAIAVFSGWRGSFNPGATASRRMDFLNQCKTGDDSASSANGRYGRQR